MRAPLLGLAKSIYYRHRGQNYERWKFHSMKASLMETAVYKRL